MSIRPALPADAPELSALGARLWRETYTGFIPEPDLEAHLAETFGPERQAAELADPASTTLILEEAGHALGYALLRARRPEGDAGTRGFTRPLEVARFYVDAARHGTGAGRSLMEAVLAHAASAGHDGLWLQVWDQNPRAIRFYAKTGFHDVGETVYPVGRLVYQDRLLVHTLMAREL
jgi:diamine N-acetyltransferase